MILSLVYIFHNFSFALYDIVNWIVNSNDYIELFF